jgi:hypothetical protein
VYLYLTIAEEIGIVLVKLPHGAHQVHFDKFFPVVAALNPGKVEDPVDVIQQAFYVMDHITNVFDLIFAGQVMLRKGFQVQFQGGHRCLQFMSEIVDEVPLQTVKLPCFLIVDKDNKDPDQDDPYENGKNKDDYPCIDFEKLAGIEIVLLDNGGQPRADADVPVYVEAERRSQRYD